MKKLFLSLVLCLFVIILNAQSNVDERLFGTWVWLNVVETSKKDEQLTLSAERSDLDITRFRNNVYR